MLTLAAALCLPPPPPPGNPAQTTKAPPTGLAWFRQADENKDGFLTFDEFPNRRMYLSFDRNNDNRLSMEELARAIADTAPPPPEGLPGIETRRDVQYRAPETFEDVPDGALPPDPRLTSLDLYSPTTILAKGERRPIIAYVHGGGWRVGDKTRVHSKPQHYCRDGYIFASINYRLSPDVTHPTHMQDVAAAIAWIHKNAERLGGDPNRIILMGHSAGAHLVSLVATDPSYLAEHKLKPADISAVVSLDTASFDIATRADDRGMRDMVKEAFGESPETLTDASPLHHVRAGRKYPPFLIVYASRRLIAKRESERFLHALHEASAVGEILRAEGKDHAGVNTDATLSGDPVCEAVDEFIGRYSDCSG